MKFSVLLPTKNRLELLKTAVFSVLQQDYPNWEIIVSDNCSNEDIQGYVCSLHDSRIHYYRTEQCVPVTDNWNNALEKSSGDYVIMLGDDDCLMKGYFTTILKLLKEYSDPDFIYTSGFLYAYPGVMPWSPQGFLSAFGNASFLEAEQAPFWLEKKRAIQLVQEAMNFKVMFAYNMQYAVIRRALIEKMQAKGKFYQTPYPDYYAMTALLLEGQRILACPYPLVMVGISPKSYGFFHFNQREEEGVDFLQICPELAQQHLQQVLLPGVKMNTFWLLSMETVKNNYCHQFDLTVNYQRYRSLQMIKTYKKWISHEGRLKELWQRMNWKEKIFKGAFLHLLALSLRCIPLVLRRKIANRLETLSGSHPTFKSIKIDSYYGSGQDVVQRVDPSTIRLHS